MTTQLPRLLCWLLLFSSTLAFSQNPNLNPCTNGADYTGSISDYFTEFENSTIPFEVGQVYTLCLTKDSPNFRTNTFLDIEEGSETSIGIFRAFLPGQLITQFISKFYDPDLESITIPTGTSGYTFQFSSTGTFSWSSIRIKYDSEDVVLQKKVYFEVIEKPAPVSWVTPLSYGNFGENLLLEWTVSDQVDVAGYELERSVNSTAFARVADIPYKENGSLAVEYSVLTAQPTSGAYYRIKQLDHAGTYDYSNVIFVPGNDGGTQQFAVFPNPARDYARLSLPEDISSVDLINSAGQVVSRTPAPEARR